MVWELVLRIWRRSILHCCLESIFMSWQWVISWQRVLKQYKINRERETIWMWGLFSFFFPSNLECIWQIILILHFLKNASNNEYHDQRKRKLVRFYYCEMCSAPFACQKEFSLHIQAIHISRKYSSILCQSDFTRGFHLQEHLISHECNKKFGCMRKV